VPGEPAAHLERVGDELRVRFCRPEVHNAFGAASRDALVEALQLAAADDTVRRVHLSGEGRSFCSGGDLREFGSVPDPATAHIVRSTRSPGRLIHELRDRVVVELHGSCIGAGIELAAFAGEVVAHHDTRIQLPELDMGLVPGAGGTVSLPRRIGRRRTAWLCLSGQAVGADRARRWGLVDAVVG
jgi:enoyl-CoA hydratase/carnithine racemase